MPLNIQKMSYHSTTPITKPPQAEEGEDDVEEEQDAESDYHQDPGETLLSHSQLRK